MEQHYYIGSLELVFDMDCDLAIQEFNQLFLRPVLSAAARVLVSVEPKQQLYVPVPASESRSQTRWTEGKTECCAYAQQGAWLSVSRLDTAGNVTIEVDARRLPLFTASFRPWYQIQLERLVLRNRALVLHSASIEYRGEAILFTAPSGTGKTTQTNLWHQYVQGVSDLNGDKTLLQRTDEGWYACGFPVYGSSMRCEQKALPIQAIVVVRRGLMNQVRELSRLQSITALYSQITVPASEREYVAQTMELLEELTGQVPVVQLDCTIDREAVEVLYQHLFKEIENGTI